MEHLPIAQLAPQIPSLDSKCIKAVVTLIWPYSSSTRRCAVLLADPDFRLRRRKGQVRVRFSGSSARALATTGIGIGDEVTLGLGGAHFIEDTGDIRTPGRSVNWELSFSQRLSIQVSRDGHGLADLEVDHLAPSPTPSSPDRTYATPFVASAARQSLSQQWSSPAFLKRARLSDEPFVEAGYDHLMRLTEFEDTDHTSKRRRRSYKDWKSWTYATRTPSPEKEDVEPREDVVVQLGLEDSPARLSLLDSAGSLVQRSEHIPATLSREEIQDADSSTGSRTDHPQEVSSDIEPSAEELRNHANEAESETIQVDADNDESEYDELYAGPDEYPPGFVIAPSSKPPDSSGGDPDIQVRFESAPFPALGIRADPHIPPSDVGNTYTASSTALPNVVVLGSMDDQPLAELTYPASHDQGLLGQEDQHGANVQARDAVSEKHSKDTMAAPVLPLLQTEFSSSATLGMQTLIGEEPSSPIIKPLDSSTLPLPSPFPANQEVSAASYLEHSNSALNSHVTQPSATDEYIIESSFQSSMSSSSAPAIHPTHESAFTDLRFSFGLDGSTFSRETVSRADPHPDESSEAFQSTPVEPCFEDSLDEFFPLEHDESDRRESEVRTVQDVSHAGPRIARHDHAAQSSAVAPIKKSEREYPTIDHDRHPHSYSSIHGGRELDLMQIASSEFSKTINDMVIQKPEKSVDSGSAVSEMGSENLDESILHQSSEIAYDYHVSISNKDDVPFQVDEDPGERVQTASRSIIEAPEKLTEIIDLGDSESEGGSEMEPRAEIRDAMDHDPSAAEINPKKSSCSSISSRPRMVPHEDQPGFTMSLREHDSTVNGVTVEVREAQDLVVQEPGLKFESVEDYERIIDDIPVNDFQNHVALKDGAVEGEFSNHRVELEPHAEDGAQTDPLQLEIPDERPGARLGELIPMSVPSSAPYKNTRSKTRTSTSPLKEQMSQRSTRSQSKTLSPTIRYTRSVSKAQQVVSPTKPRNSELTSPRRQSDDFDDSVSEDEDYHTRRRSRMPRVANVPSIKDSEDDMHSEDSLSTQVRSDDLYIHVQPHDHAEEAAGSVTPTAKTMTSSEVRRRASFSLLPQGSNPSPSDDSHEMKTSPRAHELSFSPFPNFSEFQGSQGRPSTQTDVPADTIAYPQLASQKDKLPRSPPEVAGHESRTLANQQSLVDGNLPITPDPSQQILESQIKYPSMREEQSLPLTPQLTQRTSADVAFDSITSMMDRDKSFTMPDLHLTKTPRRSLTTVDVSPPSDQSARVTPESDSESGVEDLSSPTLGLTTPLSFYVPLNLLHSYLNRSSQSLDSYPDVIAVVTTASTRPVRAPKGPRHYSTILHVTDFAIHPSETTVQIFRPYASALPVAEPGDVVMLRSFNVKSQSRKARLVSGEESAWCVWRYGKGKPVYGARIEPFGEIKIREEVKGPPVEVGNGEREEVEKLRRWWRRVERDVKKQREDAKEGNSNVNGDP